jgi:hypothetical protein
MMKMLTNQDVLNLLLDKQTENKKNGTGWPGRNGIDARYIGFVANIDN